MTERKGELCIGWIFFKLSYTFGKQQVNGGNRVELRVRTDGFRFNNLTVKAFK